MRAPMVLVLVLAGSSWFPLEHLVGSGRSLPGDLSVSTMRLLGSGAGLALALVGMRDRLRAVAVELPRLLQTAGVLARCSSAG